MKRKSYIVALLACFTLGMTTSCEDMFDIESNRVVYDHEINSTSDSVYSTLGVLQCMRKVADRYVILGEVRGDMVDINENTKTSLRNLANFNFDGDNEYLNVRDYYAIINNCNYALANMDVTLSINNQRVMMDEYVALLGIRAWTYLQLAINYGEIPYYTYPIVTESDAEKAKKEGTKGIKEIAEDLAPQLIPYLDYDLPTFVNTRNSYPVLRLVLADLYLWSGDYENAVKCYEDYFMNNKKFSFRLSDDNGTALQSGYLGMGGRFMTWDGRDKSKPSKAPNSEDYNSTTVNATGYENLAYIRMETSGDKGVVSELGTLFRSTDNTHYLSPSASWKSLNASQVIFNLTEDEIGTKTFKYSTVIGDMREDRYTSTEQISAGGGMETEVQFVTKFNTNQEQINIYRRAIACLRWAEALNALAKEQYKMGAADSVQMAEARQNAMNSFYLLKDASKVFFPDSSDVAKRFERFNKELKTQFAGVHARGCGDVHYDETYYVLKSEVISSRLGVDSVTFNDTIRYIDELIIDELALESSFEGNRFGDLIRFAKRREAWGDGEYRDFLAKRVAYRGGEDAVASDQTNALYNKLSESEEYWYLPFK